MIFELGDVSFGYVINHSLKGVRKHLQLETASDDLQIDTKAIFEKLKNHFDGKLLMDMGYCECWDDFTNTDYLQWWYDEPNKGAECVIFEKENGIVYIQDAEAIELNGFNKDFSAVAGYKVIMQDGSFDPNITAAPFNCLSGFLQGHSPRLRIINKEGEFDLGLSIRFANTLNGLYFAKEGFILEDSMENAEKAHFTGFLQGHFRENSHWVKHMGFYINNGKERLAVSDSQQMFVVGDEVTPENIAKVLKRIYGKRDWDKVAVPLEGCEIEILDF